MDFNGTRREEGELSQLDADMDRLFTADQDEDADVDPAAAAEGPGHHSDAWGAQDDSVVGTSSVMLGVPSPAVPLPSPAAASLLMPLSTICSSPIAETGVLETAARLQHHLSCSFFDTAVRRAALNLSALTHIQEQELSEILASIAGTSSSASEPGVVVQDGATTALVRRHHGQLREAKQRNKAKRREAAANITAQFSAFVETAAADALARAIGGTGSGPAASAAPSNVASSSSSARALTDCGSLLPLVDHGVATHVPAAQLNVTNPLHRVLQDGTNDATAPPLVMDVSPASTLPCCLQLLQDAAINPILPPNIEGGDASAGDPTAEEGSVRRVALQLRRTHGLRRHGVLVYIGEWREFKPLIDDARAKALDPLFSMEPLGTPAPEDMDRAVTVNTTNLWGATVAVFIPAPSRVSTAASSTSMWAQTLRRCLIASATSWRADMLSIAFGPSLLPPPPSAKAPSPAAAQGGTVFPLLLHEVVASLAWATRECSAIRSSSLLPCEPLVDGAVRAAGGRGSSPTRSLMGGGGARHSYPLGGSLRLFIPAPSLDSSIAAVRKAIGSSNVAEVCRRTL